MEKHLKNGLVLPLVLFIIISLVLGSYIVYDKVLSSSSKEKETITKTYDNENITNENNSYNEEQILALGLVRYKYANDIENIFIASEDINNKSVTSRKVTNYNSAAENFTNNFISNTSNICWPTKKGNEYYLNDDCSAGGTTKYIYKSIKVKEYDLNEITYTITLDEVHTTLESDNKFKDAHTDILQDFEIILEDNIWKINNFTYNGMPVEFN